MADQNVRVSVNERKIGNAAGSAVASELDGRLRSIEDNTRETASEVKDLQRNVEDLERRMTEIERTKAEAKQEATESIKDRLKAQYEEKKEKFREKKLDVIRDYQAGITRLKDRFINSIPGQSEGFEQVNEEFGRAADSRDQVVEHASQLGTHGVGAVHEYRRQRVRESRDAVTSAIDDFLDDRQATADTIDSLQTPVPSINGDATVQIPFWVVGVERDGHEEIHVLPILTRGGMDGGPTADAPYAPYLTPHDTHYYGDWTDHVEEYVQRETVRDRLAADEPTFADPGFLADHPAVENRFLEALREYELADRKTTGASGAGGTDSPDAQTTATAQAEEGTDD